MKYLVSIAAFFLGALLMHGYQEHREKVPFFPHKQAKGELTIRIQWEPSADEHTRQSALSDYTTITDTKEWHEEVIVTYNNLEDALQLRSLLVHHAGYSERMPAIRRIRLSPTPK